MIILILALFAFFYFVDSDKNGENNVKESISAADALSGIESDDFAKADSVIEFDFPRDHAAHDKFKTEWWYFTGNISDGNDHFGYQFTIFRNAIVAEKDSIIDDWTTTQNYLSHFALTDVSNNQFYYDEKLSRQSVGLAGTIANPLKVWLEDWQIKGDYSLGYDKPIFKINAFSDNYGIDLELKPEKNPVFQGENGLSAKSNTPGNASYYYSYTRLNTSGKVIINNKTFYVNGWSWMDREWSTSALEQGQKGWDWFSIQIDDNTEIMYFRLRGKDNKTSNFAKGAFIDKNGKKINLSQDQVNLDVLEYYENDNKSQYPSKWLLNIPDEKIKLTITPLIQDQELKLSVRYWEGAVKVEGVKNGSAISGHGYVELTGYADKNLSIK
jgi:predicted secreted hydrolase